MCGRIFPEFSARDLDEHRQDRNEDDAKDDEFEVLFYNGYAAKEPSGGDQQDHPQKCADDIEHHEALVFHLARPCNEGRECAHDGHETGDDDGFAAVLFEKCVGFFDVARSDDSGEFPLRPSAESTANPVVDRISENGGNENDQACDPDIETRIRVCGECANGK